MADFQSPVPTIPRPAPIDKEVSWDKTKTLTIPLLNLSVSRTT